MVSSQNNFMQVPASAWYEYCQWVGGLLQDLLNGAEDMRPQQYTKGISVAPDVNCEDTLLANVRRLQRAMERQQKEMQTMVPASRYMQVRPTTILSSQLRRDHICGACRK